MARLNAQEPFSNSSRVVDRSGIEEPKDGNGVAVFGHWLQEGDKERGDFILTRLGYAFKVKPSRASGACMPHTERHFIWPIPQRDRPIERIGDLNRDYCTMFIFEMNIEYF